METKICSLVVFTLLGLLAIQEVTSQTADWWRPPPRAKKFTAGEPTFIYSHGNNHWDMAWYTVPDRRQFVFKVKACESVRIMLATYVAVTDFSVEIQLGIGSNTRSQIKYPFQVGDEHLHKAYTPDILDCFEYRTFWINWYVDFIEVGRGPSIGQQQILNWFDSSLHTINAIGLYSSENVAATFEIAGNTGDLIEVITPNEYKYDTMWKSVKDRVFYSFQVRSCGDVHLLLTEEMGRQEGELYEIVIGGWNNNQSAIRTSVHGRYSTIKDSHIEYNIVDCSKYRDFWVSWYNKTIEVGKGDIYGMHHFLRWHSTLSVDVRYLSITTGWGNEGNWILNDDEETFTMLHTPMSNSSVPSQIYNTSWVEMPKEHFFQFWARAGGQEARLLLADDTNILDEDFDLQITLGYNNDPMKLCVGYMFEPDCLWEYTDDTSFLSDLHFRPFWMSWFNKTFNMGRGYFYGEQVMIKDQAMNQDFHINAIGLATTKGWGRFKFREYMGERVEYRTPEIHTNYQDFTAWRTVYTKSWFLFYYNGESDCHIALSPAYGINHELCYYDLIISGWGNTKSVIREVCDYGNIDREVGTSADTTGLLGNGYVDLWVSWYGGLLQVGQGSVVGERRFLEHNFEDSLDIRALAVQSGYGYKGTFFMYEDLGDYTTFYTNGTKNTAGWAADHHMVMDAFVRFITFWVTSCTQATVYLGQHSVDTNFDHFRVVLGAEDNTKVKIFHDEEEVNSIDKSPVVECEENRQYWISWKDSVLEVGEGYRYPFSKLVDYTPPAGLLYNLTYLGFQTEPSTNKEGRWHIQHPYGPDFQMYTSKDYVYKNWVTLEHKDYLILTVAACSDVHIVLSERMGHTWLVSYEIVIGGWNNTRSVIREWFEDNHGQRLIEHVAVDSVGINNCTSAQTFWLSWDNGVIMIGKGIFFDRFRDVWIDYHPVNPKHIVAAGFSTGYGFDGYWGLVLGDQVISPPVATDVPTEPTVSTGGSGGLSGGAIAGIVIAVLAVVALFGVVGYLVMVTRGNVKTPTFLQTPPEGSGFDNPAQRGAPAVDTDA